MSRLASRCNSQPHSANETEAEKGMRNIDPKMAELIMNEARCKPCRRAADAA